MRQAAIVHLSGNQICLFIYDAIYFVASAGPLNRCSRYRIMMKTRRMRRKRKRKRKWSWRRKRRSIILEAGLNSDR